MDKEDVKDTVNEEKLDLEDEFAKVFGENAGDVAAKQAADGGEKESASGLSMEDIKRGIEDQDDEWSECAARIKRRASTANAAAATNAATTSGTTASAERENPGTMDIDKLDVNLEEGPWEDVLACECDDIIEETEETWDPEAVPEARFEEFNFVKALEVWEEALWEECWKNTGRELITIKWVDVNKGHNGKIQIRSRLVARDFRVKGDDRHVDVFVAMPLLETKRM